MSNNQSINGMVLVNKPVDASSNRITNQIKRKLSAKKAGHTGTLDPFATGLLPVCINRGTKLVRYLIDKDKEYIGTIRLGTKTDSLDKTGNITMEMDIPKISEDDVIKAANMFKGKIKQVPPAFSALKHNGVPLYKLARQGKMIKKEPREITIYELEVLKTEIPFITIRVKCSAGTYIRTLASDISEQLGTCGHLHSLERTYCGNFSLENAFAPEKIQDMTENQEYENFVIPLEKMVDFMPEIKIKSDLIPDIYNGKKISFDDLGKPENLSEGEPVKIISNENKLIAVMRKNKDSIFFSYDAVFN